MWAIHLVAVRILEAPITDFIIVLQGWPRSRIIKQEALITTTYF